MPLSSEFFELHPAHRAAQNTARADAQHVERRKRTRIGVHWPLILTRDHAAESIETVTEDLSSDGFYCFSPKPLLPGEVIFCTLKAPTHDPKADRHTIVLECKAVALRAEATVDGLFGIACRIEDYHLIG
jgi:hypothetical protein